MKLGSIEEGRCAQVLRVGPYYEEQRTVELMEEFVAENGLEFRGHHHQIHLSDPRRTAAERLRTILRHPVS